MLARKIIVILLSLTTLGLSSCQGNRLQGSIEVHGPGRVVFPWIGSP